jgi:hypothetical protein
MFCGFVGPKDGSRAFSVSCTEGKNKGTEKVVSTIFVCLCVLYARLHLPCPFVLGHADIIFFPGGQYDQGSTTRSALLFGVVADAVLDMLSIDLLRVFFHLSACSLHSRATYMATLGLMQRINPFQRTSGPKNFQKKLWCHLACR